MVSSRVSNARCTVVASWLPCAGTTSVILLMHRNLLKSLIFRAQFWCGINKISGVHRKTRLTMSWNFPSIPSSLPAFAMAFTCQLCGVWAQRKIESVWAADSWRHSWAEATKLAMLLNLFMQQPTDTLKSAVYLVFGIKKIPQWIAP